MLRFKLTHYPKFKRGAPASRAPSYRPTNRSNRQRCINPEVAAGIEEAVASRRLPDRDRDRIFRPAQALAMDLA